MSTSKTTFTRTYLEALTKLRSLLTTLESDLKTSLMVAFGLAIIAHTGQTRKGNPQTNQPGQPYIIHPIRVMLILALELGLRDPAALPAAILHDALEDGKGRVTKAMISGQLGAETLSIVEYVTKSEGKMTEEETDAYHAHIAEAPLLVRLLKLADRVDNLRDILTLTDKDFQRKQLLETQKYFIEMAASTNSYLHTELVRLCDELTILTA